MYFLRGSLPWQGLKANTKKQKYQRILERKQQTFPEQLCRGYPTEFRDFFAHCTSLGFEDRPDYRYLKRIFKDLFERSGYEDDGVYDWDIAKKQNDIALGRTPEEGDAAGGVTVSEAAKATAALAAGPAGAAAAPPATAGAVSSGKLKDGGSEEPAGDKSGDAPGSSKRPSIISSIRNSLFGGKAATNVAAPSGGAGSTSNSGKV